MGTDVHEPAVWNPTERPELHLVQRQDQLPSRVIAFDDPALEPVVLVLVDLLWLAQVRPASDTASDRGLFILVEKHPIIGVNPRLRAGEGPVQVSG